jgi:hypothetical protein
MKVRYQRDSIDLEEVKDMVRSRGYSLMHEKYSAMLESFRSTLEKEQDPAGVRFLQGQIDCLRCVMKLPDIIADEIRSKQRNSSDL